MTASAQKSSSDEPGFGVYIHWPFCAQKCPYCDFNSHVRFGGWDEARFLAAYERELEHVASLTAGQTVSSVFFGGGTPSLMRPETTAAILAAIARHWKLEPDAEITLEANPGSVEAGRFRGFRDAGVNRVSIGVQSLRDEELKKLGRIHTASEAIAAIDVARRTFDRFSFDLIYARPGSTRNTWRQELREALELAGEHLSLYQLTIEPDTPYAALHAAGKLIVPDPDAALDLYRVTQEMANERGLAAYEISNHARPGQESRHNLLYWRYGSYAGIGPGAHGRIATGGRRYATVTERNPEQWCARVEAEGHGLLETTALSDAEQADEMLLMGLRLSEGVDLGRLARVGGVRPSQSVTAKLSEFGLVEQIGEDAQHSVNWRANELEPIGLCLGPGLAPQGDTCAPKPGVRGLRATARGRFVLNAVVAELSRSFEPIRGMDIA